MLKSNFIIELFAYVVNDQDGFDICDRVVKFEYLPTPTHREIWKEIKAMYAEGVKPTKGLLDQRNYRNDSTLDVIDSIFNVKAIDKGGLLSALTNFIKDSKAGIFYEQMHDLFKRGDRDEGIRLMLECGRELTDFSLLNKSDFTKVFAGIEDRYEERKSGVHEKRKIPFSICALDKMTNGGVDEGDTALFLARSGLGKTKLLRWIGVNAAWRGFNVLHVQAEGSKHECMTGYDATWMSLPYITVLKNDIDEAALQDYIRKAKGASGEIYVHAFESFNAGNLDDVYDFILDFRNTHGAAPDLVLIDYFELLDPCRGKNYDTHQERHRRIDLSKRLKNMAMEFKCAVVTATQASSVEYKDLHNKDFKLTREHISESKNIINPFSCFFTLNQTGEEYNEKSLRIYCDKLRHHKREDVIRIAVDYQNERFYDKAQTKSRFSYGT